MINFSQGAEFIVKMARDEDTSWLEYAVAGGLGALAGRKAVGAVRKGRGKYLSRKGLKGKFRKMIEGPKTQMTAGVVGGVGGVQAKSKLDEMSNQGRKDPERLLSSIREHRRGHK